MNTDGAIIAKLRVKRHDNLPFTGWAGTREEIAQLFGELGFKRGALIGVSDGSYAEMVCRNAPGVHLLCIDPWMAVGGHKQSTIDKLYEQTKARLSEFDAELIKKSSIEAAADIEDRSLDFVYINGNLEFNDAMLNIIHWTPKVRVEGIVSGYGFFHQYRNGMVYAVEAYTRGNNIVPWYVAHRDADRKHSWLWASK